MGRGGKRPKIVVGGFADRATEDTYTEWRNKVEEKKAEKLAEEKRLLGMTRKERAKDRAKHDKALKEKRAKEDKARLEAEYQWLRARVNYAKPRAPLSLVTVELAPSYYRAKMENGNGKCIANNWKFEEIIDFKSILFIGNDFQARDRYMAFVRIAPEELEFSVFPEVIQTQLLEMIRSPTTNFRAHEIVNYTVYGPNVDNLPTGDVYYSITPSQELIDKVLAGENPDGFCTTSYYPFPINIVGLNPSSKIKFNREFKAGKFRENKSILDMEDLLPEVQGRPTWVQVYPSWSAWLVNFYHIEMFDECVCRLDNTKPGVEGPVFSAYQDFEETVIELRQSRRNTFMYFSFRVPMLCCSVVYAPYTTGSRKDFENRDLGKDVYINSANRWLETALKPNSLHDVREDFIAELNKSRCGDLPSELVEAEPTLESVRSLPAHLADSIECAVPGCDGIYLKNNANARIYHYSKNTETHKVECLKCHHSKKYWYFVLEGKQHQSHHAEQPFRCANCLWGYTKKETLQNHSCPNPTAIRRQLPPIVEEDADDAESSAASDNLEDMDYQPPSLSSSDTVSSVGSWDKYIEDGETVPLSELLESGKIVVPDENIEMEIVNDWVVDHTAEVIEAHVALNTDELSENLSSAMEMEHDINIVITHTK